mgnify:CR=1 FL=1
MAGEIKLNDVSVATENAGTVTIAPNNVTFAANHAGIKAALNASGNPGIYACRAWVNFDGTTNTAGFCTIRDSGNVSTVADNGTGTYTVNFTTAMPDANFAVVNAPTYTTSGAASAMIRQASIVSNSTTTSAVQINTGYSFPSGYGLEDQAVVAIAIFR